MPLVNEYSKPEAVMPKDKNNQLLPILSLTPDCIYSATLGSNIVTTNKTILIFETDVSVKLNGAGISFIMVANKEIGVSLLDTVLVEAAVNYILI